MKQPTLLMAALLGFASFAQAELAPGDDIPDFKMKGSDGETYTLKDFKGKQAFVIAWYPKAFTGGCTAECKSMRESGEAIREFDVAYFTASTDDVETNTKFAESLELDYPILSDPEREVVTDWGMIEGGKKNAPRWTFYVGKDGKILEIDKSVSTKTHGADIAAKLEEFGVDKK